MDTESGSQVVGEAPTLQRRFMGFVQIYASFVIANTYIGLSIATAGIFPASLAIAGAGIAGIGLGMRKIGQWTGIKGLQTLGSHTQRFGLTALLAPCYIVAAAKDGTERVWTGKSPTAENPGWWHGLSNGINQLSDLPPVPLPSSQQQINARSTPSNVRSAEPQNARGVEKAPLLANAQVDYSKAKTFEDAQATYNSSAKDENKFIAVGAPKKDEHGNTVITWAPPPPPGNKDPKTHVTCTHDSAGNIVKVSPGENAHCALPPVKTADGGFKVQKVAAGKIEEVTPQIAVAKPFHTVAVAGVTVSMTPRVTAVDARGQGNSLS